MSKVAHTLGSWILEGNWDPSNGKPLGGWVSFSPSGPPMFELDPIVGTPADIVARARLIVAAPELLEALSEYVNRDDEMLATHPSVEPSERYKRLHALAKAALARAEGRHP